ncbi:MAG: glucuronate isomerase, partial [Planctomycetota bacterium]
PPANPTPNPTEAAAASAADADGADAPRQYDTGERDWSPMLTRVQTDVERICDFLEALAKRHVFFHDNGCRLSDHGMSHLPEMDCSEKTARDIFDRARGASDDWLDPDDLIEDTGHVSALDEQRFRSFLMTFFGRLDHAAGWTQQLHLGVIRNNNSYAMEHLGPDTGFDSICDTPQFAGLRRHLGTLAGEQKLPQTILYNLNPKDNYLFATMAGNFQGVFPGVKPGHVQLGSGWWFLDQKEGMQWQLNALSNLGLLPHFIGMLTDSRSFLSYPRHEYFRRILCNLIGQDAEAGELPNDLDMLGSVVQNICFNNARDYFGMDLKI